MKKKMAAANYLGIVLIILSIALFFIMFNFSNEMLQLIDSEHGGSCSTYEGCPHVAVLNQAYMGYGLSAIIFVIGVFLLFYGGRPAAGEASVSGSKKSWEGNIKTLTGDEKKVYETIMAANGVMFQSELVERSGFPKAKVSRILDRLEAGRLAERKRRGMANAIVLK